MSKPTVQFIYDTDVETEDRIQSYLHCTKCLLELPKGQSPRDFSRTQVGITRQGGFQVWCVRHDVNVACINVNLKENGNEQSESK